MYFAERKVIQDKCLESGYRFSSMFSYSQAPKQTPVLLTISINLHDDDDDDDVLILWRASTGL
jgi:hypothetical protein